MIDSLTSALSTYLPDAAAAVAAPAIQGAGVGALSSLVTGQNPWTSALVGGGIGGAYGAFGNNGPLSNWIGGTPAAETAGLLDSNGNYITPPIPPAGGDSGIPTDTGNGAAPGGGTYNAAGQIVPAAASSPSSPAAFEAATKAQGPLAAASGAVTGGGVNKTALALGALSALASAMNKPQQGTWQLPGAAQNPNTGPLWNAPLNTSAPGRTATNPWPSGTAPSYWTYGGPEANYFTGNSLKSFGFARGGDVAPRGAMAMADGGDDAPQREVSTANGDHYVQGPGDGQADKVPAALSDGEYILTAADVSRIGGGSSNAGAKRIDQFRNELARKAGQKKFIPKAAGGALNSLMERAA